MEGYGYAGRSVCMQIDPWYGRVCVSQEKGVSKLILTNE